MSVCTEERELKSSTQDARVFCPPLNDPAIAALMNSPGDDRHISAFHTVLYRNVLIASLDGY